MILDEEMIVAYLDKGSYYAAAKMLGVHQQSVRQRINNLRNKGVNIPDLRGARGPRGKFDSKRRAQLNEFIANYEQSK